LPHANSSTHVTSARHPGHHFPAAFRDRQGMRIGSDRFPANPGGLDSGGDCGAGYLE